VSRSESQSVVSHYNVQPVFEINADVQGRDLGGVSADVSRIVDSLKTELPRGSTFAIRGQVQSMNSSFAGLAFGLLFAVLLVYFLMVVNFQSWLDPFIILTALPGALAGILWMLYLTRTTVSVPALMGAIMCIGVATSNSILMVTFANDQRREGADAQSAALAAGRTRLRPVLMTALAMMIGMLPMSLGLGEGGEQNAPLGRAVIGGLLVATAFTLLFVPVMYSLLRRKAPKPEIVDDWTDERTVLPSNGHRTEPATAVALATSYVGTAIDEPMQGPVP
jgi:multidrug efflux pump subunit AcrB